MHNYAFISEDLLHLYSVCVEHGLSAYFKAAEDTLERYVYVIEAKMFGVREDVRVAVACGHALCRAALSPRPPWRRSNER